MSQQQLLKLQRSVRNTRLGTAIILITAGTALYGTHCQHELLKEGKQWFRPVSKTESLSSTQICPLNGNLKKLKTPSNTDRK